MAGRGMSSRAERGILPGNGSSAASKIPRSARDDTPTCRLPRLCLALANAAPEPHGAVSGASSRRRPIGAALGLGGFTFVYAKGASYLSTDPAVCANCHIMSEHFDAWQRSSHRAAAGCADCHMPHDWSASTRQGLERLLALPRLHYRRASRSLQIKPHNRAITEGACRECHADIVAAIDPLGAGTAIGIRSGVGGTPATSRPQIHDGTIDAGDRESCIRCHTYVGHMVATVVARRTPHRLGDSMPSLGAPLGGSCSPPSLAAWRPWPSPRCSPTSSSASRRRGIRSTAWSSSPTPRWTPRSGARTSPSSTTTTGRRWTWCTPDTAAARRRPARPPRSTRARSSPRAASQEDPRLMEMWAGYAFAKDFREERGHAYMLDDQVFTERQQVTKQPGTCLHCHASMYVALQAGRRRRPDQGLREAQPDAVLRGEEAGRRPPGVVHRLPRARARCSSG